jgi:plasmid maintenance system antidote protein VapI
MAKGIDEQLRQAILDKGEPVYLLANAAGVAHPVLYRFMNGERDLTMRTAAKLCRHLGLELGPKRPKLVKRRREK